MFLEKIIIRQKRGIIFDSGALIAIVFRYFENEIFINYFPSSLTKNRYFSGLILSLS